MSDQEQMFRLWIGTLVVVLDSLIIASSHMEHLGDGERIIEVLTEEIQKMVGDYTPEQRKVMASVLAIISGVVDRIEPPS